MKDMLLNMPEFQAEAEKTEKLYSGQSTIEESKDVVA